MSLQGVKRRLAAILSADVAGYSRLMGEDEEATLRTLSAYRRVIDGLIAKHRGRVFGSAGDSVVAEFASAVDAVRCAAEVQHELNKRNAEFPDDRRMRFRIGINLGDIMVKGGNLFGDGVNVAARLGGLAEPGGICISGAVYDQVKNKLSLGYDSLGEHKVKNIAEPVRVYRLGMEPQALRSVTRARQAEQRILIVDDEPDIRAELEGYLKDNGYLVGTAGDGEAMRQRLSEARYDLVIMDLIMPGEDGLTLTQEIRRSSHIPVIMLTGKGETIDRIVGLEMGADDYVTKPFELRELLARVRAVLRRAQAVAKTGPEAPPSTVEFGGWRLDLDARDLTSPEGQEVGLTTAEFKLLEAFVTHPKKVLDRDHLLDLIHGRDWSPYDRSIDNLVARLRRKIEADPGHPKLIKSVRGVGYLFASNVRRG